jgi:FkbM family methyltransferase
MNDYEADTSAFIAAVHEGGHILDVGANIGLIALRLATRIESRNQIFAVEAMPSDFKALEDNIRANEMQKRVQPLHYALGENDGDVAYIQIEGGDADRTGTANILPNEFEFQRIPLTLRSIDALAAKGVLKRPIKFIKIDTDGYDLFVLRGAHRLMTEDRPIVLAEAARHCMNWHGVCIDDIATFAISRGYELWSKQAKTIRFEVWRPGNPFETDALLVPREKTERLAHLLVQSRN